MYTTAVHVDWISCMTRAHRHTFHALIPAAVVVAVDVRQ